MNRSHMLSVCLLAAGCALAQSPVFINPNSFEYLDAINSAGKRDAQSVVRTDVGQTVSVSALRHKVPDKAKAAFSRALKFEQSRQWEKGAEGMKKALAIDPDFSDAYSNLGADYIALRRFRDGVAELRHAIALDPGVSSYHSNIALAYLLLHEHGAAQVEAETAVNLDGLNRTAQYILGLLLSKNPRNQQEAQRRLTFAASEIPEAHLVLAGLYRSSGDESKANLELERYRKASSSEQNR